jgi:tetratricopeptide (TPR) repeat protein
MLGAAGELVMRFTFLVFLFPFLILNGCANFENQAKSDSNGNLRLTFSKEGLKRLESNNLEEAYALFNAGLKYFPGDSNFHFLNGLTYHIKYLRGEATKELAEKGYEMSLSLNPTNYYSLLQLGRLHYESKNYTGALNYLNQALVIEPESVAALYLLAKSAYFAKNIDLATESIEKIINQGPLDADMARSAALIFAAKNNFEKSGFYLNIYLAANKDKINYLQKRIADWKRWHSNNQLVGSHENSADGIKPVIDLYPKPYLPSDSDSNAKDLKPIRKWFDCGEQKNNQEYNVSPSNYSGYSSGYYAGSSNADETSTLNALPSPCLGAALPKMAIFDVTILRTEDISGFNQGINILNGLTYTLNLSKRTDSISSSIQGAQSGVTVTDSQTSSYSTANNAAGIVYSLNIANSTEAKSEIIAQPSLLTLDRQPSTFFSGRSVTLGIAGQNGGYGSFNEKSIGVSLSATPTFVDEDTLLVSVKAARSFLENPDAAVAFSQNMQTTRNSVSASVILKFGQTLILSGLSEQEIQRSTNGVPILQDIPIIQYLFKSKASQNFKRSVLVLITPRRPQSVELTSDIRGEISRSSGQSISQTLSSYNKLFNLQFRQGDLEDDKWSEGNRFKNLFHDLRTIGYY